MQDYKKAIIKINEILPKKEKEALVSKGKVEKTQKALIDMDKKLVDLDKAYETQINQLEGLKTLEENLKKELDV